jgi:hypothetical protein
MTHPGCRSRTRRAIALPLLIGCFAIVQLEARTARSDGASSAAWGFVTTSDECQTTLSSDYAGSLDERRCASWVESGSQGFAGEPGRFYLAFLSAEREQHSLEELSAASEGATPAGRVYLATLMFRKDKDAGRGRLEDIARDSFSVFYQHGCIFPGEERSAGEIAQSVLSGSPPPGLRP